MFIPVIYSDKKIVLVPPFRLDELISTNGIIAFRRSSGWVLLGEDPVRDPKKQCGYAGPERRCGSADIAGGLSV